MNIFRHRSLVLFLRRPHPFFPIRYSYAVALELRQTERYLCIITSIGDLRRDKPVIPLHGFNNSIFATKLFGHVERLDELAHTFPVSFAVFGVACHVEVKALQAINSLRRPFFEKC
jgi:hypothetical protein